MKEIKQVKVCLGRFQPFTLGHLKMATYKDLKGPDKEQQDTLREQPNLDEIANQKTIILAVSTPEEKVDTRHPFNDYLMKKEFDLIKSNYKNEIEDVLYVKSADICAWGELLKQNGYQASVWLTGSDEYKIYKSMSMNVEKYEEPIVNVVENPISLLSEDNIFNISPNVSITLSTEDGYFKTTNKNLKIQKRTASMVVFSIPFGVSEVAVEVKEKGDIVTKTYRVV